MQVKKFEAPTLQEALDTIKRELGPEAIILQTKKYKRGFGLLSKGSVEVTAAVSDRSLHKKSFTEARLPEPSKTAVNKMPAGDQAKFYDAYLDKHLETVAKNTQDRVQLSKTRNEIEKTTTHRITPVRYADILDDESESNKKITVKTASSTVQNNDTASEIQYLKKIIEELRTKQESRTFGAGAHALMQAPTLATPVLNDAYEKLVVNGVDKRYALDLVKKVGKELGNGKNASTDDVLDHLAMALMETTEIRNLLDGINSGMSDVPRLIAVVGPTGAGKTTTVAKIATEAKSKKNLKVGLINLDYAKPIAFEQLATYSKILNVPFRSAESVEDFKTAIQDFRALDLVLIDTGGFSQRDGEALKKLHDFLGVVDGIQVQLVLSATTRDTEIYDITARFSAFRPQGIIVSKLDEATVHGVIYNVSQRVKLPLVYFTTGQRVPEDIEVASPERVAALVMDL